MMLKTCVGLALAVVVAGCSLFGEKTPRLDAADTALVLSLLDCYEQSKVAVDKESAYADCARAVVKLQGE